MSQYRNFDAPDVLCIDMETSGLYIERLPFNDPGQPWAMQISAGLFNKSGMCTNHFSNIIKSEGREVKPAAYEVHGITRSATSQIGTPESRSLGMLIDYLSTTVTDDVLKVVTFSDFDRKVLVSLFARYAESTGRAATAFDKKFALRPRICFIDIQKPFCQMACKIPSGFEDGSYKWPTLDEACETILGLPPRTGVHDAHEDMRLVSKLYFKLREQGAFISLGVNKETKR